jgi:hypothetical protein
MGEAEPADGEELGATAEPVVAVTARNRQQAVGDFTGDGYADCASLDVNSGLFSIYPNLHNGTFAAAPLPPQGKANPLVNVEQLVGDFNGDRHADVADHIFSPNPQTGRGIFMTSLTIVQPGGGITFSWGSGGSPGADTAVGASWETLVGDFTGDGFADFADHNISTGDFYIHENTRAKDAYGLPIFAGWGVNWGQGKTKVGNTWETLIADFTGDGFTDYADHNLTTGEFWVHENLRNGTFASPATNNQIWGYGKSNTTAPYVTLVGDFTGDGYADYIDYNTTTGDFWIHQNLKNGGFAGYGYNWGSGNCKSWLGYAVGQSVLKPF